MFVLVFRFRLLSHASLVKHVAGTCIHVTTRVELKDSLVITLKLATTNTDRVQLNRRKGILLPYNFRSRIIPKRKQDCHSNNLRPYSDHQAPLRVFRMGMLDAVTDSPSVELLLT
jgi:hypothetical protein